MIKESTHQEHITSPHVYAPNKASKYINLKPYMQDRKRDTDVQIFGLYGRRRGWADLREQHWNMYIIKHERDRQSRLDAWDKCSGLVHWEDPEGSSGEGGGRWDRDGEYI